MSTKATLGVVTIAQDEERDLPLFLEHLLPWVDEIVIVDGGSTDRTVEICRNAGPKVVLLQRPMRERLDFAAQRNVGIEAATASWLLHVDVDNWVPPALCEEIRRAIEDERYDAYNYRRLNFFLHRPMRTGGWQFWNQPWFARRETLRFKNTVHERAVLTAPAERVGQLQTPMWHVNDSSFVERLNKNIRYSQLEADKLLKSDKAIRPETILLRPLWQALKAYLWHGGYRSGVLGLIHAMYVFSGTFNWYAVAWDRKNAIPREQLEAEFRRQWAELGAGDKAGAVPQSGPFGRDVVPVQGHARR